MTFAEALRATADDIASDEVVENSASHEIRNVVAGALRAVADKLEPTPAEGQPTGYTFIEEAHSFEVEDN